jgi:hypothetical protein
MKNELVAFKEPRLLAEARKMANHADTRTTQPYDRRGDVASLDEYGKMGFDREQILGYRQRACENLR